MDSSILSLFDTIETKPETLIPADDMQAVQDLWNQFMEKFNSLHALWTEFTQRDTENKDDRYEINSLNYIGFRGMRYSGEWKDELAAYSYTFKYDIVNCEKLIKKLCNAIEYQIIRYFNSTYRCNLESNHLLSESLFSGDKARERERYNQSIPQLQTVLDDVVRQNNGMSFVEKGIHDSKNYLCIRLIK